MLRVAIAGAGMVSLHHLRAWQLLNQVEVVAIVDPDLGRARARASEFGIASVFEDAESMFKEMRPDALDIAAGHAAHRGLCLAAAEHGAAVLCQKPLAPTLAEASAIVDAVGSRVRLMVHENWRFRPWYRQARAWIAESAIGLPEELTLTTRSSGFVHRDGSRPALDRQPMLAEVSRLMIGEVLVHHLDVACCMLGPMSVLAAATRPTAGVRGETAAEIGLAGAGIRATISGDLADPSAPLAVTDSMHIAGSTGSIRLDGRRLALDGHTRQVREFDLVAGYQDSYNAAIAHFADALVEHRSFETTPQIHLKVLALAEDAYRLASRVR